MSWRKLVWVALVAVGATACGGGGGEDKPAANAAAGSTTMFTFGTTTSTVKAALGPVPTASTCPTSAELQTILTSAPTEVQPPDTGSGASVSCRYVWRPQPLSQLSAYAYRYPDEESLKRSFAKNRQDAQDEADGKTGTAHKTGPGKVTTIDGLGDEAYLHYEQKLDYTAAPEYEVVVRKGSLLVRVNITDASRFGPEANRPTQAADLAKLIIQKVG